MTFRDFKNHLHGHAFRKLSFVHPDGGPIPAEFHITEVGHVTKRFIDCGGTLRTTEAIVLQAWVSEADKDHRLTAGKAAGILELAKKIIPSDALEVEVEYEGCVVSQYTLGSVGPEGDELRFEMVHKHTDCLAKELCCPTDRPASGKCCA